MLNERSKIHLPAQDWLEIAPGSVFQIWMFLTLECQMNLVEHGQTAFALKISQLRDRWRKARPDIA